MKKSVLGLAVACAFCGSAVAADVTLYGIVDTGVSYKSVDWDGYRGLQGQGGDSFSMESGQNSGSRFGLRGNEELGNGLTVSFVLENGFSSDTGSDGSKFFDRESQILLSGDFGKIGAGRTSGFLNDAGTFGLAGTLSAFGTGWGSIIGNQNLVFAYRPSRTDNTLTYQSPKFAGVTVYAQYAMGDNEKENESFTDRYYSVAATYEAGAFNLLGVVDYTNKDSSPEKVARGDDTWTFTLGANYTCDFATTYLAAQYFDNASLVGGDDLSWGRGLGKWSKNAEGEWTSATKGDVSGFGVIAGANIPLSAGNVMVSVGYMSADSDKTDKEVERFMIGAGYEYPLSKRTKVYAGAGYLQDSVDNSDPRMLEVVAGLKHSF